MEPMPTRVREYLEGNPSAGRNQLSDAVNISKQEARMWCRIFKGERTDRNKYIKGIGFWDMHIPYQNKDAVNVMLDFIEDFQPDEVVNGGDFFDFDQIGIFNTGKVRLLEGRRLKTDYKMGQAFYDDLESRIRKPFKKILLYGNHEDRLKRLFDQHPKYIGLLEMENYIDMEDWTIVPYNESYRSGNMTFIHGFYYNMHHAKKNVETWTQHVFSGHVHTNQVYTTPSPANRLPKQGVSVGCLSDLNPEWKRGAPNGWVHQFMFYYLFPDGSFTYYTPIIINGRCVIHDKVYGGD